MREDSALAGAYYNEWDKDAAAWIRELIKQGHIAPGEVDTRSILDVTADDLRGFTQCHFFAGIGGWSYALRLAGWPDDQPVWTGSPPCQPFSSAGRQKGKDDERHLAPHFVGLVGTARPPVLFGEQVASAAVFGPSAKGNKPSFEGTPPWAWIDDLSDRLEAAHYAIGASDFSSAGVGAPHIRQRTYFGAVRMADVFCLGQSRPGILGSPSNPKTCPHRQASRTINDGGCGRLGDSDFTGRNRNAGSNPSPEDACWGGQYSDSVGSPSTTGGVGDSGVKRRDERGQITGGGFGGIFARRSTVSAASSAVGWTSPPDSPWSTPDWLYCRDGKWRPVESGTFPLAHGVSARVGRLRGYGNAINPWAAKAFIETFKQVLAMGDDTEELL